MSEKARAIVLGCGRVGATLVRDLAADPQFTVTASDVNEQNLQRLAGDARVTTRRIDLSSPEHVREVVREYDIVLGALSSRIGFQTLRAVIEAGRPYCDISFLPEDAMELDALAKDRGVTAVIDCGVAPGLSNLLAGHAHSQLDRTANLLILVGGLPKTRRWPYQYKAPFAPSDVIEEYTRPSRFVEHGKIVVQPALSEAELIDFPKVGTLEAFLTDGLRSLVRTLPIPNMKEKTLRYPGHVELMRVLRETGYFSPQEIEVGSVRIRPLDVTAKLLFPHWALEENEEEFTVLRVVVEGERGGRSIRYVYDLFDEYDRATRTTSMARATAFPCTIMARLVASGVFREPGVFPPELIGRRADLCNRVLNELRSRGVNVIERIESP